MTILILNKRPLRATPYHEWISGCRERVVLLTAASNQTPEDLELARSRFRRVEVLPDYDTTGLVELTAIALHAETPLTGIVALSEVDLVRAAALRERFGITGQSVESATAFRDKLVMKTLAGAAGIAVPRMRAVTSPLDLIEFAEDVGYPLILKPRTGAGTIGVTLVESPEALARLLRRGLAGSFEGSVQLLAEEYVAGAMFHVDGVFGGGEVHASWPHAYLHDMLAVMNDGKALSGRGLAPDHPLRRRLQEFAAATLAALPHPPGPTAFHLEAFHTADDRLVLCEVASRAGGNGINDMVRDELGIDMCECAAKAQAGVELPSLMPRSTPAVLGGWLLAPPRTATFGGAPERCDLDYVSFYQMVGRVGRAYVPAGNSVTHVASFVFSAPDAAELERRQAEVLAWFDARADWSPPTAAKEG
jgi:hypothetical protein